MLLGLPTAPRSPEPLNALFIDDRLHCYGPDLCARLRYSSLAEAARVTPAGSVALLELGGAGLLDGAGVSEAHPLRVIEAEAEVSVWIGLAALLVLCRKAPHPLAETFDAWAERQREFDSLFAVPLPLFDEGLDLLARAIGPTVQVLGTTKRCDQSGGRALDGQVVDPPDVFELGDIVGSCLEDEVFLLEQFGGSSVAVRD
ncbi:hypothetical protein [Flindersiella endophytica]